MRHLRKSGIGEVLDHEGHVVLLGPAQAENCSGESLAGFQGDAGPTEFAA